MKKNKRGRIIVISGPSGVGKRTVWTPIINDPRFNLVFSVSMTTFSLQRVNLKKKLESTNY